MVMEYWDETLALTIALIMTIIVMRVFGNDD